MPKVRRSVSLSKESFDWINEQIEKRRFKDVSYALECMHALPINERERLGVETLISEEALPI